MGGAAQEEGQGVNGTDGREPADGVVPLENLFMSADSALVNSP